jgi:hypothetical protein
MIDLILYLQFFLSDDEMAVFASFSFVRCVWANTCTILVPSLRAGRYRCSRSERKGALFGAGGAPDGCTVYMYRISGLCST